MLDLIKKTPRLSAALVRRVVQQPTELLLLCQLAWWVAVISVSARCFSLPRALRIVSAQTSSGLPQFSKESQEELARNLDLILSVDVLMFRPICWKRAAVLHRFLALRGITSRICFGVSPGNIGEIKGHAWLEVEGQPILEKEPPDYVITYSFPSNEDFNSSVVAFSHE